MVVPSRLMWVPYGKVSSATILRAVVRLTRKSESEKAWCVCERKRGKIEKAWYERESVVDERKRGTGEKAWYKRESVVRERKCGGTEESVV